MISVKTRNRSNSISMWLPPKTPNLEYFVLLILISLIVFIDLASSPALRAGYQAIIDPAHSDSSLCHFNHMHYDTVKCSVRVVFFCITFGFSRAIRNPKYNPNYYPLLNINWSPVAAPWPPWPKWGHYWLHSHSQQHGDWYFPWVQYLCQCYSATHWR